VGISGRVIDQDDVDRALESAQAVAIPHNREIIHVIQRGFNVDGQEGVRTPVGMHGYRLEVETHIITASASSVANLRQIVSQAGKEVIEFVLNPLASAEVVLTETERQMGCVVVDLGGGTTDLAIYINGDVYHTAVKPYGGNHVTNDIAQGLRLPLEQAEQVKVEHGYALASEVDPDEYFTVRPFGEEDVVQISRRELAEMIEARLEEILLMVIQEIKRSGYDGLLPAGVILTGGVAQTPGLRSMAAQMLGVPVRVAKPENLLGMSDKLDSPAFATSVGLLKWALMMSAITPQEDRRRRLGFDGGRSVGGGRPGLPEWAVKLFDWLKRLTP
jgi:cell division protein FtsA